MINLLPEETRQKLVREYWLRVTTLWAVLVMAAFLGIGALFVPSYFLTESEKQAFEAEHAIPSETAETIVHIETEVTTANEFAAELEKRMVKNAMTDIFRAVSGAAPEGVVVQAYTAERANAGIESVQVSGTASSRESLIAFQKALEAREEFVSAEVPIDDFIKESDLPFEIRIVVADNFR